MLRKCLVILALITLPVVTAHAADAPPPSASNDSSSSYSSELSPMRTDLLSFGWTYVDFDKFNNLHEREDDFRLEYRFGAPLLISEGNSFDFGMNPLVGGEVSTQGQLYGFGGFAFNFLFWKHLILTESEAVGLFDSGNAPRPLGSFIEFRSQVEAGWRFDNDMRFTAVIGHISNAGLTHQNPGEEMAGVYLHVPVNMIFGD
jgi:lipid A 3-O-deacylase